MLAGLHLTTKETYTTRSQAACHLTIIPGRIWGMPSSNACIKVLRQALFDESTSRILALAIEAIATTTASCVSFRTYCFCSVVQQHERSPAIGTLGAAPCSFHCVQAATTRLCCGRYMHVLVIAYSTCLWRLRAFTCSVFVCPHDDIVRQQLLMSAVGHGDAKVNCWEQPTNISNWKEEHVSALLASAALHNLPTTSAAWMDDV